MLAADAGNNGGGAVALSMEWPDGTGIVQRLLTVDFGWRRHFLYDTG